MRDLCSAEFESFHWTTSLELSVGGEFFEMILNIQLVQIVIVTGIVLCAESIEISYENGDRRLTVKCQDSHAVNITGHSELIDNGDFSGEDGWENALKVHFSFPCDIPYVPQTFLKRLALIEYVNLGFNKVKSIKGQDFSQNNKLENCDM